jgi:hypothetical protein
MSLIGPRPERPEFAVELALAYPNFQDRLAVRPGITGLAQIQLPADSDLPGVGRKLNCDLCYIQQMGLWLDLRILAGTVLKVFGVPLPAIRARLALPPWEGPSVAAVGELRTTSKIVEIKAASVTQPSVREATVSMVQAG